MNRIRLRGLPPFTGIVFGRAFLFVSLGRLGRRVLPNSIGIWADPIPVAAHTIGAHLHRDRGIGEHAPVSPQGLNPA